MTSAKELEKREYKVEIDVESIPKKMKDFKERWREQIKEIKTQSFDKAQCNRIRSDFKIDKFYVLSYKAKFEVDFFELQKIETDLEIALEIAYSKFIKERRGAWSKIFRGIKIVINLFNKQN